MTNLLRPYLTSHQGMLEIKMQVRLGDGSTIFVTRELEPQAAMKLAADIIASLADDRYFVVRQPADK